MCAGLPGSICQHPALDRNTGRISGIQRLGYGAPFGKQFWSPCFPPENDRGSPGPQGSDYVNFTIKVGNKIPYTLIRTTTDTTLYGYFYSDSSYSLSNAQIKGSISIYDGFALTGKFQSTNSNTVTIDGVNYKVNDSKVSYIIAKK